ncbi:MAG: adenosylmethionine--8-amino-7-oxononanoate transaminase [Nitrospiraceae bacterium]
MNTSSRIKQLERWDHRYLWHPFTQMQEWTTEPPLIIERGKGAYVFDVEGRRYLDGVSSLWVNIHGHRHPVLDHALTAQMEKIAHSTLLGLSNPPAIELARALVRVAPRGLTRVFYSDNGSTAVEAALKMAVQYWQQRVPHAPAKTKFVRLTLAYHGDTLGAVSVGNIDLFHGRFGSLLFPTLTADAPYCYRCPLKLEYPSCRMACLEPIETLLRSRHEEIAGVILEPIVQAAAGMVTAPSGYLKRIRELCTGLGVLLIADEVATGFGRTGRMFACQHEDVTPDLMAVSKGLTGGYMPLAATLTTEEIYEAFLGRYDEWKTFFHGHSYTGNPLGCAVALANLRIFRRAGTLSRLRPKITLFSRLLNPLAMQQHVGDIRQRGFMVGIELVKDRASREPYPLEARVGHQVALESRRQGLLLRPLGNVLMLVPPLTTTSSELTRMVSILHRSIEKVTVTAGTSPIPCT